MMQSAVIRLSCGGEIETHALASLQFCQHPILQSSRNLPRLVFCNDCTSTLLMHQLDALCVHHSDSPHQLNCRMPIPEINGQPVLLIDEVYDGKSHSGKRCNQRT